MYTSLSVCSAGIGRTGTLICVRSLIQMIEEKKEVDVFNFILKMRQNRINMVQTEASIHHNLLLKNSLVKVVFWT